MWIVSKPNNQYFEPMPCRNITVPITRIEEFTISAFIPAVDVIWMDVQGCELEVVGMNLERMYLEIIWMEVTYKPYYENQKCVEEYDQQLAAWGLRDSRNPVSPAGSATHVTGGNDYG
jgi:hypothetical protein